MNRIQIFRAGTHLDMNGAARVYTRADLAATAAAYNPAIYTAPLVLGHPDMDAPAYGSVRALHAEGDKLYADVQPTPDLVRKVREGAYISVSAALYAPNSARNPTPGVWALRHVGFLGGQPPAVKGMEAPAFADGGDSVAFAQPLHWHSPIAAADVSYSEDPDAFHQACLQLSSHEGVSYAEAAFRLDRKAREKRLRDSSPAADPSRQRDHERIVAYMESDPSMTYAQAFRTLAKRGDLKGF